MTKIQLQNAWLMPLPTGTRNQWKRDTKGTHKRHIPVQTAPFKGSIREDARNKRNQLVFEALKARQAERKATRISKNERS